jgi:insertion element IS1 protein InsB
MWSYVGKKANQRWLWQAVDHETGIVLAYTFGKRNDRAFQHLKTLLEPFKIQHYYTDDWGSYQRLLAPSEHTIGKRYTQRIERTHLTLRTRIKRLARRTICFSKLDALHDTVIGLFINRHMFHAPV